MKQLFILALLCICACSRSPQGASYESAISYQSAALDLVREEFRIECDHMKNAGIDLSGVSAYDFRAEAFQQIIKNPDRKLLQHYEVICQQIADAEFHMSASEKARYRQAVEDLYAAGCP